MPPAIDLARRYAEALAALRAVHVFDAWLGDHWQERCPVQHAASTAQTPLGSGECITWHETADTVIGYLPGQAGCFQIPRHATLPDFPQGSAEPPIHHADIVISATMGDGVI